MRILITGGTGTLGSALVNAVEGGEHRVRVMSRRSRPERSRSTAEWVRADLQTGEGLAEAASGIDAVLHAATSPRSKTEEVDVEGTRRLTRAAERAGASHFLYPSIVGIEDIPFSYYRCKLRAERIVEAAGVPHTILRATQFHSLVEEVVSAAMRIPLMTWLPTDFLMQSVAPSEVAARVHERLEKGPGGRVPNFGGPQVKRAGQMVREWMQVRRKEKRVFRLPLPGGAARAFRKGKNTDPGAKAGKTTWREWLGARPEEAPPPHSTRA